MHTYTRVCLCVLDHVQLFVTPQAVACQALLFMGLSQQEYWSGLPFSPLWLSQQGSPYTHTHTNYILWIIFHKILSSALHKMKRNVFIMYILTLFHRAQAYIFLVTFIVFIYIFMQNLFTFSKTLLISCRNEFQGLIICTYLLKFVFLIDWGSFQLFPTCFFETKLYFNGNPHRMKI